MKSTLILLLAFLACFMFQTPAFAGSANQNANQPASILSPTPQSTSKVTSRSPQKWVEKVNNTKVGKWISSLAKNIFHTKSDFDPKGFWLGFFLGFIGLLIAVIKEDRDMMKWAWIGWAVGSLSVALVFGIVVIIANIVNA